MSDIQPGVHHWQEVIIGAGQQSLGTGFFDQLEYLHCVVKDYGIRINSEFIELVIISLQIEFCRSLVDGPDDIFEELAVFDTEISRIDNRHPRAAQGQVEKTGDFVGETASHEPDHQAPEAGFLIGADKVVEALGMRFGKIELRQVMPGVELLQAPADIRFFPGYGLERFKDAPHAVLPALQDRVEAAISQDFKLLWCAIIDSDNAPSVFN